LAEFTGERVIPGEVDADLLNEHMARYVLASRHCQSRRVLDIGCGAGYGSAELASIAMCVLGLDISDDAILYAGEHYRLPKLLFAVASALALPQPDASFDVVVAFEVIEHLEEWRKFLSEVDRVLKPGGLFLVSTPNKVYYAESRAQSGPNPFHVHEFEYAEFRKELSSIFPHVSIVLENHTEGVAFQPVDAGVEIPELRIDAAEPVPAEAHFFVAICSHKPIAPLGTFVYVPSAANVLRERERHIRALEDELGHKDAWLEQAHTQLAGLNQQHTAVLGELEERNRWAESLDRDIHEARGHIARLQQDAARFDDLVRAYEAKIAELEAEVNTKAEWARNVQSTLDAKLNELEQCVEYLHQTEKTVEERSQWAVQLEGEVKELETRLATYQASPWVKAGRAIGLGPKPPAN
jgi:SAM-dependent methyltransferase/predicted  nucleic acid-binding Zn-ribbon protein